MVSGKLLSFRPFWLLLLFACGGDPAEVTVPMPLDLWGSSRPGDWARYRVIGPEGEHRYLVRVVATGINRVAFEKANPDSGLVESAEEVALHLEPIIAERYLASVTACDRETVQIGSQTFQAIRLARRDPSGTSTSWYAHEVTAGGLIRREGPEGTTLLEAYGRGPVQSF